MKSYQVVYQHLLWIVEKDIIPEITILFSSTLLNLSDTGREMNIIMFKVIKNFSLVAKVKIMQL